MLKFITLSNIFRTGCLTCGKWTPGPSATWSLWRRRARPSSCACRASSARRSAPPPRPPPPPSTPSPRSCSGCEERPAAISDPIYSSRSTRKVATTAFLSSKILRANVLCPFHFSLPQNIASSQCTGCFCNVQLSASTVAESSWKC